METQKSMKTLVYFTLILTGMVLASCTNNTSTGDEQLNLSQNEEMRQEVYDQILNDEELLDEFLNQMMQNSTSMHWMMQHQPFMRQMFNQENVDYIMQHHQAMDLELMQNMMNTIQRDTSLEREWEIMYGEHDEDHMDQMHNMN